MCVTKVLKQTIFAKIIRSHEKSQISSAVISPDKKNKLRETAKNDNSTLHGSLENNLFIFFNCILYTITSLFVLSSNI